MIRKQHGVREPFALHYLVSSWNLPGTLPHVQLAIAIHVVASASITFDLVQVQGCSGGGPYGHRAARHEMTDQAGLKLLSHLLTPRLGFHFKSR